MKRGTLYVVATPIGNLGDVTLRALETLKDVDLIAAEDTRRTRKLLSHHGIRTKLLSFHEYSPPGRLVQLMVRLRGGESIALVTNAGTPNVSDPGARLVRAAFEESISVTPVPGASAVATGLAVCGMPANQFVFLGFLPRRKKDRLAVLANVCAMPCPLVVYEGPHRLKTMVADLRAVLGDREVTLCRELTKAHEEVKLTRLATLVQMYRDETPRGEFTLVIAGAEEMKKSDDSESIDEALGVLLCDGLTVREAAAKVANKFDVSRRVVYSRALKLRDEGL